ncbi:ATP-dependent helicase HrpB [Pantoea sp. 1.19]|uniref:ATP-dependent helicase HrpB n=1 Tax=Pantoea sp. 1.19 TaxID=1925589 RepID=UPI0009490EE6|nr:ATP-dependent helicase HrpB [Pantoea sp. 1.19]
MEQLPVSAVLPDLLAALRTSPQVLLVAPTGAGKSTWLPLQLLQQAGLPGRIILLEPRRLAARNVAQRLAEQLGESPGETVGYRMRAESCVSARTRLEVVTEGILTRQLQQDPLLEGVSLVILDEFHERSLQADLALALLRDVQGSVRDDLRLLLMSATLDNSRLREALPDAPLIVSEGRSYPVERRYQALPGHLRADEAVAKAVLGLLREASGSLLLFLPGVGEIQRVQSLLAGNVAEDTDLAPLYGALPLAAQQKAILPAPPGRRKVVLATNIAETSLTIEGIRLVVDSALERAALFESKSGLTRLVTQRISQASMTQRAGRAGRLAPGLCLHLLGKEQAERAPAHAEPEILQSDLSGLRLELLQWGCQQVETLNWLDTPPAGALQAADRLLQQLGALAADGQLSARGRRMAALGSDPRLSAMLVAAGDKPDAVATAALLAAIVEEPPRGGSGDLREAFWRPQHHWQQRARQLQQRLGIRGGSPDVALAAALLAQAWPDRLARRRGAQGRYQLANGVGAMLAEDDALTRYEWLLVPLLLQGQAQADARIIQALPVVLDALLAALPELVQTRTEVEWDEARGTLRALRREQIGQLVLREQPLARPDAAVLQQAMLRWIARKGLAVLNWTPAASQLRLRLRCAARWLPEEAWPAVDDEALLASLDRWLLPQLAGVQDVRQLQQIDLSQALLQLLTWSQRQRLDSALPTHYTVPTGSRLALRYDPDNPPALAVRVQEMYGEADTPRVAEGRVPVVLELLSPAQRPLQVTSDLAGFWRGAWSEVQKEMKGRYPKHLWPDDPATTLPTRRSKKFTPSA